MPGCDLELRRNDHGNVVDEEYCPKTTEVISKLKAVGEHVSRIYRSTLPYAS